MTRSGFDGPPPQGPDPMDFGEYLRRALHAAADQVEPHTDGLERIRARVRSGAARARRHSAAPGGFLAGRGRWATGRGGDEQARRGAARDDARQRPRDWRDGLLRPVLAAACAVFAIGVVLALPPLR